MLEEISEDQTDQLSPPVTPRARPVGETPPRDTATPLPMPATSPPASGQASQYSEEAPERVADSPLTSLSLSPHLVSTIRVRSPLITRPWAKCYDIYRLPRILVSYIKENPRSPPCPSPSATLIQTGQEIRKAPVHARLHRRSLRRRVLVENSKAGHCRLVHDRSGVHCSHRGLQGDHLDAHTPS